MREEFRPAIDALLADLAEQEKQVVETKLVINRLCSKAGMNPLFPDAAAPSGPSVSSIRPDSFYGKVLSTAAREYLEMRRSANLGPATPREVYEALVKGGYAPDTKDETTAIISVRATLRKNSSIFHRLPNGTYGLLSWYPNAKPEREEDGEGEHDASAKVPRGKLKRKVPKRKATKGASEVPKATRLRNELKVFLANGKQHKSDILKHMIETGILGKEDDPGANLSTYLSRSKDLVRNDGEGNWSLVASKPAEAA